MVTRTYEGQMPLEEEVIQGGSVQSLTRNFLGGRGLEAITTTENNVTTTAYPLYDTHGNMVATLTKNASGTSWNLGNERTYDVWGGVRSGNATGGPKGRYCANLGHVQDDESGLIYMRARYYEPSSGRFISEDPIKAGGNWYVYARNTPSIMNDPTGLVFEQAIVGLLKFMLGNILMGNIDSLMAELDNISRYIDKVESMMMLETPGTHSSLKQWAREENLRKRREVMDLHKKLKRLKTAQATLEWGSRTGKGLDRILGFMAGYSLVLSALIDDIDLGPDGYGSLEGVFGG